MQLKPFNIFYTAFATVINVIVVTTVSYIILGLCENCRVKSHIAGVVIVEIGVVLLSFSGVLIWHKVAKCKSIMGLVVIQVFHLLLGMPPLLFMFELAKFINSSF